MRSTTTQPHSGHHSSWLQLAATLLFLLSLSTRLLAQNGAVTVTQSFSYTGQIVTWIVPTGVTSLTIEARGAEGAAGSYDVSGGKGAIVAAQVSVTPGQNLSILVGQQPAYRFNFGGTGGGGTFVVAPPSSTTAPTPLVIAGGGGGGSYPDNPIKHGQAARQGSAGDRGASGGSNGSGGARNTGGSGGGGLLGDGDGVTSVAGGKAFVHGGVVGGAGAPGGGNGGGGGGGGYSGGGGGYTGVGGGGGSYYPTATTPSVTTGTAANSGNGLVIISYSVYPIRYVKATAAGTGDGSSWANASSDLQAMINASQVQQVWVAQGTYKPGGNANTNRFVNFSMKDGVAIYGGFVGNETSLSQRPAITMTTPSSTTLSGDIGTVGNRDDNSYHVIYNSTDLTTSAVLDGFLITGGNSTDAGGGMYNVYSSPTVRNCSFQNNSAVNDGGAMCNYGYGGGTSSPVLINCSFLANSTMNGSGGAMNNDGGNGGVSSPVLTNCSFLANSARYRGGAMYTLPFNGTSSPVLTNCVLFGNGGERSISTDGGGTGTVSARYSLFETGTRDYNSGAGNRTTAVSPFVSANDARLNACAAAINAGDNAANSTTTDLAGNPRRYNGGQIDMGAYEYQGDPNSPISITRQPASGSAVCPGSTVSVPLNVSGTVSAYQWYKDGQAVSGQTSATLTLANVQPAQSGSYSIIVTGACNSVTSTAFSLTVNAPPVATLTASPSTVLSCAQTSLTLTADGGNGNTYAFSGPGVVSQSGNTAMVNVAGTYSVTVTNASGCTSTTSITISQDNTAPSASLASSGGLSCSATSVTLTASPNGQSYRFSEGATPIGTTNQATVTTAGIYSVTVLSGNGCSSVASTTVTGDQTPPTVAITPTSGTLTCQSPTLTLTATTSVPTLRWSSGQTTPSITVNVAGTYSVTVTNTATGCTNTTSVAVSQDNSQPTVSITPSTATLTCGLPTATLTANTSASSLTWNTGQTTSSISVSLAGTYSVTVTSANGCMAMTQATVSGTTDAPTAPILTASPSTTTTNQPITVTTNGCTGGVINWTALGGAGQANGNTYTLSQPGNYTLSATCSLNGCTSSSSTPLSVQIRPGGFAITGVGMVNCQLIDEAKGGYQVQFTAQYAGQNSNPISFSVVNELAPTTAPAPYALRLYTDNPVITLVATQAGNGEARFAYNWLASCQSGTSPNQPPTTTSIPNQTIVQGQGYQLQLTSYFSDPDGQALSFQASGLPAGLTLAGSVISGTPSQTGVSTVNVTALDPGGLQVSTSFQLTVNPMPVTPPSGFAIVGVSTVSCQVLSAGERRLTFTPQYAGVNGTPISFSVVNELVATTSPGPYSLNLYTDNPTITLSAQQGATVSTYRYNWLAVCTPSARVGSGEVGLSLTVRVLGNPVAGNSAEVEISGVSGQPVQLNLVDLQGKPVHTHRIEQASALERVSLPLGASNGVLLLQVSTLTQRQQVKLLRTN
ncbi:beta strand repeat-containing protein [Spirosoma agri]|uniref:Ig-like domain-containing protein n=1 Tax=Spirosoma agri TaxID=1987381 RepID=A0A6M0IR88_9BACT|nr:putative Ig domain-containing protein [Spirosoma agri]NEU70482.1 hypothetical protein [Spirosoma agri]